MPRATRPGAEPGTPSEKRREEAAWERTGVDALRTLPAPLLPHMQAFRGNTENTLPHISVRAKSGRCF